MKKWLLLLAMCAVVLAPVSAQTLTKAERDFLVNELKQSEKAFLDATKGLTPEQWNFKSAPDRWSVAECAEHITLSEDFLFGLVNEALKSPAVKEKKDAATAKQQDEMLLTAIQDRSHKAQAPEPVKPSNKWPTRDALVSEFEARRKHTLDFATATQEDLRAHIKASPLVEQQDAYQWVLFLSAHTRRHTAQILEVKADPKFPK